ncbi:unnamed protein product, partial [Fusarium langsethiae]
RIVFKKSNTNTPLGYGSNNPFLDIPNETPSAYESISKSSHLGIPRRADSPAPSITSVTNKEERYAFLTTLDSVFVIDDSGSMASISWREVRKALSTIAPICISHDPDSIDFYFLNHLSSNAGSGTQASGGYYQIRDADQALVSIAFSSPISRRAENIGSTKPVNVIVTTDGCPTDDPKSIIAHHTKKLDHIEAPPHQIGIQFFQVGNEHGATKALRELDDGLNEQGIRDMVDTTTWNSNASGNSQTLSADGIP